MIPGLDLYCTDPAQPSTTAGEELGDLENHLSINQLRRDRLKFYPTLLTLLRFTVLPILALYAPTFPPPK